MAHSTTHHTGSPIALRGIAKSAGQGVSAVAGGFWNFMIRIAENNSRARQVEFLGTLSDSELARRGLKRENIVRHVYKDMFYI